MTETSVVQFVGFTSNLPVPLFVEQWEAFAARYANAATHTVLQQQVQTKGKYRFISKHQWPAADFQFSFMGRRKSDYFPDRTVKVVQIGGYIKANGKTVSGSHSMTMLAFLKHQEYDLDYFRQNGLCHQFNEYTAFYESCLYGHVFEFFITAAQLPDLVSYFKMKPDTEIAVYQKCSTSTRKTVSRLASN
jgi:hypothetical protein